MPTKTATKKSSTPTEISVRLDFTKETKNTLRFDNTNDGVAIPSLYIRKDVFNGQQPSSVVVTVVPE